MNNKKKQTAVMAMATVLSVTTIASPLTVMAQEDTPAPPAIMQEENGQQKTAPDISLPENLQATAGTALEEITLPEHWSWAEKSTVITADREEYPARFSADDVTYDYSDVEGYNAEGHYVERMVAVTVEIVEPEPAEPVQKKSNRLLGYTPIKFNTGEIAINETNFPDDTFRQWIIDNVQGADDRKLTSAEIASVGVIDVRNNTNIKDLTGIEHFTSLTYLNCYNTGITSLNVSKNKALYQLTCNNNANLTSLTVAGATELKDLDCDNTGITSLDVSQNTKLTGLWCFDNANFKSLTVAGATELTILNCENTGITSLDVSQNAKLTSLTVAGATELTTLNCSNTGITSLDVSKNTKLTGLWCSDNANLKSLTVAGATELTTLNCSNTGITRLEVSNNTKLKSLTVAGATELTTLNCNNTGITSLDVSQNAKLIELNCNDTPLAYLNIGTNSNLVFINKNGLKPVNLEIKEDSFNIADKFAGIDKGKITNVRNADYNSSTGIMSNYSVGTPIIYSYDCGTSRDGAQTISVTLNLTDTRGDSTISITENLSKTYDKTAVNATPAVSTTGSSGAVSFTWEQKKSDTNWEQITSAPTDAGTYRVTANLASDSNYKGAISAPEVFIISQATNSWTYKLSITGWTYGETANNPVAVAKFGTVDYLYSNSGNGTYKDIIPTNAGTWYVKAVVESTDNYKGLESDAVKFEIKKAKAPAISLPVNLSGVYDTKLSAIALPAGWAWINGDVKLTASNAGYKARLTVDDSNYDYTGTEGYNSANHYVERTLTVTISKAENIWTQKPVIAGWTYGETASEPTATAKYGAVTFLYSDSENGAFTPDKPTNAGIWYMKAVVNATDDYTGLNEVISFTISQEEPSYTVPQDLEATFGQTLADVTLPAGFSWTDDTLAVGNAGKNTFTAVFTPDDTKNYKTVADISVALTVKKADNALTNALSIEGWTYGGTPAVASAGFRFGKPRFLYSDKADGTYTETVPTNAGTWYVKAVVDGTDNYEGAESNPVSFVIAPRNATANNQITVPDITADTNLDEIIIKDGDKVLVQGTDYDVAKTQDGNKVTVAITFKGNYTGTITRSYTVASSGGDKDNNKPHNQNTDDKKAVQTGDTTSLGLWSSLLAFSAGIAVFLKRKKQRKETEE